MFEKIKKIFRADNYKGYSLYQSSTLRSYDDAIGWGSNDFLKAEAINLYTNRAIGKRAEGVGMVKWLLFQGDKKIENDKLLDLLNKPNSFMTGKQFWSLWQRYKDVFGSAFIHIVQKAKFGDKNEVIGLELLRPDCMKIKTSEETNEIVGYEYNNPNGKSVIFEPVDIIFSYRPSLSNPHQAESLLKAGARQISTESQLADYHSNVLKNGGQVDGVFTFDVDRLNETQLKQLKDQYDLQYKDARKSGKPLFLGGKAKYERLSLSLEEMDFLESKKVVLSDICIMTGVPKTLLGNYDDVKFDNAEASRRMFLSETIKPLIEDLKMDLQNSVLVEEGYNLDFIDPTPENIELILKENDSGIRSYYMTPNEAREKVGLDPIKGGDKLYIPFNVMPNDEVDETENKKKIKKIQTKSPACRMDGESKDECVSRKIPELIDEGYDKDQAIAIANELCSVSCDEKKFKHPLKDKKKREKYWNFKIAKEKKNIKLFEKKLNNYFKEQLERITEGLKSQEKGIKIKNNLAGEIFNNELEIKIANDEFLPLLESFMLEAGIDTFDLVSETRFNFHLTSEMKSWLNKKVNIFIEQITETTFKRLQEQIAESIENGEDRRQLIDRIEQSYSEDGQIISKARAGVIARTEVGGVMTRGTFEAYKQAQIPVKIWVWSPGVKGGVREEHFRLDGEEKPIDTPFSNGLMYPRDENASASEVINCECQI